MTCRHATGCVCFTVKCSQHVHLHEGFTGLQVFLVGAALKCHEEQLTVRMELPIPEDCCFSFNHGSWHFFHQQFLVENYQPLPAATHNLKVKVIAVVDRVVRRRMFFFGDFTMSNEPKKREIHSFCIWVFPKIGVPPNHQF